MTREHRNRVGAPALGCIADDFTGATDVANNLAAGGLRVIQTIGVPAGDFASDADAIVIALKSRTIDATDAVAQSLEALRWLQAIGAGQIYFKYCSTFDSTAEGNIGPVTDGLMSALGVDFTIACPAFPRNQRTVFKGHLFVGRTPLHESSMRDHPLTPMRDSNLVRVLQMQTSRTVGLVDHRTVALGAGAIAAEFERQRRQGVEIAIVDAISDADLHQIGHACASLALVTGGSGVAIGLPHNFGIARQRGGAADFPAPRGYRAVVSGSCSAATNTQVARFTARGGEAFKIEPSMLADADDAVARASAWAARRLGTSPVLVYSTAAPSEVRRIQEECGVGRSGALIESILSKIALRLVQRGAGQLIVAGGETAGACVQALGVKHLVIGREICAGVPWCYAPPSRLASGGLHLALKSGNFGDPDFFSSAFDML